MWRRNAWSLVLGICVSLQLEAELFAQVISRPPSLLNRTNAAQFEIVLGRITATNIRPGPARSQTSTHQSSGITETMTVGFQGQTPTLHYECVSPEERFVVDITRTQEVMVHHIPYESDIQDFETPLAEVAFHQDARGKVRLIVKIQDLAHEYKAASLWHLMLAEPLVSRLYFVPLAERLRPNWELLHFSNELRHALLRFPQVHALPERSQIDAHVARLGHKEFKQRQAADRELRRLGPVIVPYLQSIDPLTIDSEQRSRLRGILAVMQTTTTGDTLERAVQFLAADKAVWLMFLSDEDLVIRQTATAHLGALQGKTLDFDPLGEPAERMARIGKLRKSMVRE